MGGSQDERGVSYYYGGGAEVKSTYHLPEEKINHKGFPNSVFRGIWCWRMRCGEDLNLELWEFADGNGGLRRGC
jgi:hypothetical protein